MSPSTRPFFLPSTRALTPAQYESLYNSIKTFITTNCHYVLTDRRIFKIALETHFSSLVINTEIEVGKPLGEKGEVVIAIFEIAEGTGKGWFLVCTKSRGALKGHPHCVNGEDVVRVVGFGSI